MKIIIQSVNSSIRQQLLKEVEKKLQKLRRLFGSVISAEVRLTNQKQAVPESRLCYMRLVIPGNDLIARTQSFSFEEALSKAVEAMERQIEKRKTKMRRQMRIIPAMVQRNKM